jgi:hypothetical protein
VLEIGKRALPAPTIDLYFLRYCGNMYCGVMFHAAKLSLKLKASNLLERLVQFFFATGSD